MCRRWNLKAGNFRIWLGSEVKEHRLSMEIEDSLSMSSE